MCVCVLSEYNMHTSYSLESEVTHAQRRVTLDLSHFSFLVP